MESAAHHRVNFLREAFDASPGGVQSVCWKLGKELQSFSLHIDSHRSI
jgi:hypothetical protein